MREALGYIRVSTATQARDGESLAVQRELIQAVCALEGLKLTRIFVEEGASASKPLSGRPVGGKLLAQVKPGQVVIALRLDRMFRDTTDALQTLSAFKQRGIGLFLKDVGGHICDDSVGNLIFSLMSCVASFERSRTRERIVEVKASLAKQGRYMGGDAPFGYSVVQRDGQRFVEPDQAILEEVSRLNAQGYSTRLTAGHFAQRGVSVTHHAIARCLRRMASNAQAHVVAA